MKKFFAIPPATLPALAMLLSGGGLLAQTPAPAAVLNPASNIPAGYPNSGIAQGSIIVVYGTNLGPASLTQATSLPLPTSAGLGGTSVKVTVNGTTVTAPMIYTLATQVAAILPSTTPLGSGMLTVAFNGASGSTPITVVASNFGISTVNQSGTGPAVVTFTDYSLVTDSKPAKPGDVLILWGTGLGATSGSDAILPVQTDLGTSIQLLIGGTQANILYRGRSASPGLDQINFVVPSGTLTCGEVSLGALTGTNIVSNYTSIPVTNAGGTCSGTSATQAGFLSLLNQSSVRFGFMAMDFQDNQNNIANNDLLTVQAGFFSFAQSQFASFASAVTGLGGSGSALGQCAISYAEFNPLAYGVASYLDAGASLTLKYQSGSTATMGSQPRGYYATTLTSEPAGTYSLSSAGGADVGSFSASFSVSQPLVWTNVANSGVVNRSQPYTITWTGGDENSYTDIAMYGNGPGNGVNINCSVVTSVGSFTIPPALLQALPAGTGGLTVASGTLPVLLTIPGIDYFLVSSSRPAQSILTIIQ